MLFIIGRLLTYDATTIFSIRPAKGTLPLRAFTGFLHRLQFQNSHRTP